MTGQVIEMPPSRTSLACVPWCIRTGEHDVWKSSCASSGFVVGDQDDAFIEGAPFDRGDEFEVFVTASRIPKHTELGGALLLDIEFAFTSGGIVPAQAQQLCDAVIRAAEFCRSQGGDAR